MSKRPPKYEIMVIKKRPKREIPLFYPWDDIWSNIWWYIRQLTCHQIYITTNQYYPNRNSYHISYRGIHFPNPLNGLMWHDDDFILHIDMRWKDAHNYSDQEKIYQIEKHFQHIGVAEYWIRKNVE